MDERLEKFGRITLTFALAAAATYVIGFILLAYVEMNNEPELIQFTWQLVLLGLVTGAAISALLTVPAKLLPDAAKRRIFIAAMCSFSSTTSMFIGMAFAFYGYRQEIHLLMQVGSTITAAGIFMLACGLSMVAMEAFSVIWSEAGKLARGLFRG